MPKFLDHHKSVNMPAEAAKKAVEDAKARRADKFGVIGINAFISKSETWCLTEAPNADAVHKSHEGYGLKLGKGDVSEVTSLV